MNESAVIPAALEEALDRLVFATWDPAFLATPIGQEGKREVLFGRYQAALRFAIPWLRREIDLASARVVEIGCGSGSSTVALAQHSREVIGYDIDGNAVVAARAL